MTPLADLLTLCLDEEGAEPLYRRLYLALREAILRGGLRNRLPSTRRLAQDLGISRNSVAAAYDLLHAEGYLSARMGAGSYVSDSLPDESVALATATPDAHDAFDAARLSRLGRLLGSEESVALPDAPFNLPAAAFADFPWPLWSRLLARPYRRPAPALFMRPDMAGLPALRQAIATMLGASRAMRCGPDQVLITGGTQQALDIACRLLVDPDDDVMVEDPSFRGIDEVVTAAGGHIVAQAVDSEGLVIPGSLPGIRVVVVTPSRNFPLDTILSLPRRVALLQAVKAVGGWIIEDDYDAEFRFARQPLTSLFGLDHDHQVLYAGGFNRTMFPALRLGYLVVPEALISAARAVREACDGGQGTVLQAALAAFIDDGHYGAHLRRQRLRFAAARRVLTLAMTKELGDLLEILPADGGLTLTAVFRHRTDDHHMAAALTAAGIAARPLSAFYRGRVIRAGLVLHFAGWPDAALTIAVNRMAAILRAESKGLSESE